MPSRAVHALWATPRVSDPPGPMWRDWLLVAGFGVTAVLETVFRDDVVWPLASLVTTLAVLPTLFIRRTQPLAAIALGFGTVMVFNLVAIVGGADGVVGLNATAFVLFLPYALLRWGSGRDIVAGTAVVLVAAVVGITQDDSATLGDVVGGFIVLCLAETLGLVVRFATSAQHRARHDVRVREREQLARELHDTVAHHVSAIVVRAQAGRVVAATRPEAAAEALEVIEGEAGRTLAELRTLVSALREDADAELTPMQGVADLERLAAATGGSPRVELTVTGIDDLRPSVAAAVYRITQESITNVVRHARHATRVEVSVAGEDDVVRLTVRDDGDPAPRGTTGYGVIGMTERAVLLGGTLEAGPAPGRGWTVSAVLPRTAG
ncbi:sensor histidine kinase [Nocardioides sp. SR21]|uniref:sensor histidine kinase n=1 Tax=Nocardioides sp. SR21 TaxID=2919501 RepID=UPI001FAACBFE|nr:sensor histidine kinase [Nocardioides sp. SR21]